MSCTDASKALLQLGLGRNSLLFKYDDEKRSFFPVLEQVRMSGYSLEIFQRCVCQVSWNAERMFTITVFSRTSSNVVTRRKG